MSVGKYRSLYIYIVTNPAWKKWVKIGITKRPQARLLQYQTGSPLSDYTMFFYVETPLARLIEKYFTKNIMGVNEWFKISPSKAKRIINKLIKDDNLKEEDVSLNQFKLKRWRMGIKYIYYVTKLEDEYSWMDTKKLYSIEEIADFIKCNKTDLLNIFSKKMKITFKGYEIIRKKVKLIPKSLQIMN